MATSTARTAIIISIGIGINTAGRLKSFQTASCLPKPQGVRSHAGVLCHTCTKAV